MSLSYGDLEWAETETHVATLRAVPPSLAKRLGVFHSRKYGITALGSLLGTLDYRRALGVGRSHEVTPAILDWLFGRYKDFPVFAVELAPADMTTPVNLREMLRDRGFVPFGAGAALMTGESMEPPVLPDEVTIREIRSPEARTYSGVMGWADCPDPLTIGWRRRVVEVPEWHHFILFVGPTPTACGAYYLAENDVVVFTPAYVREDAQVPGLAAALTQGRWLSAAERGATWYVAEAGSAEDLEMYRGLGARVYYGRDTYLFDGGGEDAENHGEAA